MNIYVLGGVFMEKWKVIIITIPYIVLVISFFAIRIQVISGNSSYGSLYFSFLMFWSSFFISIPLTLVLLLSSILLRSNWTKIEGMTKYCAYCGHTVPLDGKFCEFCGKEVKEEKLDTKKLYKQLLDYYYGLYSNGNRLEKEIELHIKKGLSRDKAILKIAEEKGFIGV
jgi:hypothetical protein